jgi:hypothetical protein
MTRDGARYADLDNAFLYRKQLVANCTCNGKDAFGLAPFDLSSDPTLRPGDIVSTKNGLLAYTGKTARGDSFVPLKPSAARLNAAASRRQSTQRVRDRRRSGNHRDAGARSRAGQWRRRDARPEFAVKRQTNWRRNSLKLGEDVLR